MSQEQSIQIELPWCDLKVAFDISDDEKLWDQHESLQLPEGWELNEVNTAGGRAVAVFRVEVMPTIEDGIKVAKLLEDLCRPPSYSDPGRLLAIVHQKTGTVYRFDYEVPAFDDDSSVFWIQEGEGFDYWLNQRCEIDGPGIYLFEGITGTYRRGDGYTTDDDVDWNVGSVRKLTVEEALALDFGLTEDDLQCDA